MASNFGLTPGPIIDDPTAKPIKIHSAAEALLARVLEELSDIKEVLLRIDARMDGRKVVSERAVGNGTSMAVLKEKP